MAAKKSTAVAKAKQTEVSTDVMDDLMDFAGEGTSYDSSEMMIPFVRLAQSLSPQLKRSKPEYIEGLNEGDAYNSVTGEYWDGEKGIRVIPCFQTTKYLEFTPRDQGGGFKGEIAADDPILRRTERSGPKELLPHGNEVVKSDQHFCLVLDDDGGYQPAVVDMKSTQLKVSRRWKTQIAMQKIKHPKTGALVTPPLFGTIWHLKSVEESNDQGDWSNWVVEKEGLVDNRDLLIAAKAFRDSVAAGEVKAHPEDHDQGGGSSEEGTYGGGGNRDDEIPF